MANIGKVVASAFSATNENQFSLVNINADFSLLKVEAPIEYQGLGAALSTPRRKNAEQGPLHRTARKLGALFEQILPPIKTLAEAYGKRVSEIAASEKLKSVVSIHGCDRGQSAYGVWTNFECRVPPTMALSRITSVSTALLSMLQRLLDIAPLPSIS
jgi:hypothetical protein